MTRLRRTARRVVVWNAVLAACLGSSLVYADPDGPPAVDISDLPPLPQVEDEADTARDIAVAGAAAVQEYVVVGASKREQSLGTVASAVSVIPANQLRRFGYRTVAEALRGVVGLYIVDDRMVERVGIRGVQLLGDANTRILILVDGSTINEPWSQFADSSSALPVHIDDVARIEIIRGPVSSIYGTNAFLGIVNIVTIEADKAPKAYGRLGVGSYGSATGNAAFGTGTVDRQVRGFVSWVGSAGESVEYPEFETDGAGIETDADQTQAIIGAVTVHYDRLFAQVRASQRSRELPGAPYDSAEGDPANENTDRRVFGEIGYTQEIGDDVVLAARVYANQYRFESALDLELEGSVTGAQPFSSVATSLWYGGELRGLWSALPKGKLDITAGVAGEFADTKSDSMLVNDPVNVTTIEQSFNVAGVYSEVSTQPLSWVAFTGGVRYDRNSKFDERTSPRAALFLRKPKRYGLKLLYAQGFRNPSIFETFFNDGQRYRPSGNELRSEIITSYEGVAWWQIRPGVDVRLSGWQWDMEDLIEKRSVLDPDVLAERFQFQNLSALRSRGVEFETSYRDTRGWFARAAVSLADVLPNPDALGVEDPPINAPSIVANGGLSTPALWGVAHLSTEVIYLSERNTRDEDVVVDPWLGINAAIYIPKYKKFDFTIGVRNIIGTREQVPAQVDYDRVFVDDRDRLTDLDVLTLPGSGREFFARAGYQY